MTSTRTRVERIDRVRRFNRHYTKTIGVLSEGLLDSPYSLTEVRVMLELRHTPGIDAAELCRRLDLDAGYLSRILARFDRDDLLERERSEADRRRRVLSLTPTGVKTFDVLDDRQIDAVASLVDGLDDTRQREVLAAMDVIEAAFTPSAEPATVVLRDPLPGELGWVISRNGAVYAAEHGWNGDYEALVARVVAGFATDHDPQRERAWIAEMDGRPVGSIFCMRGDDEATAKLRVLLVEASARGQGIGGKLIDACVDFARAAGYRRMVLWTVSLLADARRLYQRAGFQLESETDVHLFGHDLTGQNWGMDL
ncbi:bifunctional helix-turn-helix transcriptional regulator/GNAT family N-acetyltransferase [Stackebrandtia nassauensis]|uniref:Transcriptional regulator, MarR family with acetyltransferase activity n=1 Tax=Stackebrandtia nassauensis (strain DSM 44728 / CIP 108903 / NRRL B-16338 / NBRC 102104 / LLR-40K-21) TaxID=446470 RepID=D3PXP4_STANL|nr:helix-turn-helix domain-containing GNAT family N-acetyltransferase [Stackebrandtia nassauensis]ADD43374.1 transcriptional regulator, MarR family with acetyltransferase activity [Stackebrandtia nassauensis DSM 44728]